MEASPGDRLGPVGGLQGFWLIASVNLTQALRRLKSIREQSRLLSGLIVLFLAGYLWIAYALFSRALRFMSAFPGLGPLLVERMIYLLFAFLFFLLLISNLVISYTNLFRNRETAFLLTLPLPRQAVFSWKFVESALVATWAFLFLIAPLLMAYGLTQKVAWHFYLVTAAMIVFFIVLPAIGGAFCAICIARFLDRQLFQVIAVFSGLAVVGIIAFWMQPDQVTEEMLESRVLVVLDRLLHNTRLALFPFLPSYWLSSGIIQWSEGARGAAGFFGLVLLSYTTLFGFLTLTRTGSIFYQAASAVNSRAGRGVFGRLRRKRQEPTRQDYPVAGTLERIAQTAFWLPSDLRAMMVKDIRIFWRDTSQWAQSLLLFGLLATYIINLRHFSAQTNNPFWVHLVSFLNLGACSLNLATLTTRFVYPQFSLEGKRIWIVGMAPVGIDNVIKTKYWTATTASLLVTVGLMTLSCRMLRLPWDRMAYFITIIFIMTLTLNGLAMGLGTLYPNFKEENPSKIVTGFGGTLCLVLSFFYIVSSLVILAIASPWNHVRFPPVALGWTLFAGLSAGLGWLPFKRGIQTARQREL